MTRIPHPRFSLCEGIRYEDGAWPLWRWDRNLAYIAKSLVHKKTPWTEHDRDHAIQGRAYLESGRWAQPLKRSIRIAMGGDLMWIRRGFREALSDAVISHFRSADVGFVNLETPIVPERAVPERVYETLHYNAPPSYLDRFAGRAKSVFSLINNHALDQGEAGLARTREVVEEAGFIALGGLRASDAWARLETASLRVEATGVTYGVNHSEGKSLAGIPFYYDRFQATDHHDLRVVMAHWGHEYEYWPSAAQRTQALAWMAQGVDIILGSSPHVLQPVEVVSIDGADPACPLQVVRGGAPRFGLIIWSLGNLATIMPTLACRVGAVLEVDIGMTETGMLALGRIQAFPTVSARGLRDGAFRLGLSGATMELVEFESLQARGRAPTWPARAHAEHILGEEILKGIGFQRETI